MSELSKFLWVDVETTGLDPVINAPHQVSGELIVKGISVEVFDFKFRPRDGAVIEPKALETTFPNMTFDEALAELMVRPLSSKDAYLEFNKMLCKYIDKYDKQDKAVFCAYNAGFDSQMINSWYAGHGNKYFFGLCHGGAYFDPLQLALLYEMKMGRKMFFPDRKLTTVAKHFGVLLEKAHDALYDIRATRDVAKILYQHIVGA
jgi:DNA polymerase-3 subunit epsilon